MKTKLHKTLLVGALALMGGQAAMAQAVNTNYFGVAYKGVANEIGNVINVPERLELENFDALFTAPDGNGGNYGVKRDQIANGGFATYYAKATGNSKDSQYRDGSDVEMAIVTYEDGSTGHVLASSGSEFTFHTITVKTAGTYHLNLNYKSFGGNKPYQVFLYNVDNVENSIGVLMNATNDNALGSTNNPDDGGYIYRDSPDFGPFILEAKEYLIMANTLTGGPTYDYISFTLDSLNTVLSVDEEQVAGNKLSAYPNPSVGGIFTLSVESNWEVYNVLGAKLIQGKGTNVNLSGFAKGVYLLKTPFTTKTLIKE